MLLIALVLGVVEGLTEFLPVSSTGHLILAGHVLGFTGPTAASFEVFVQLGAILAVVWLYRQTFLDLLPRAQSKGFKGRNGLWLLALTTLPAVIAGLLLHGFIKDALFNPLSVAIGLLVGGIAILFVESHPQRAAVQKLDNVTLRHALRIGLFQLVALFPGISRSGATILGGMQVGLSRETAVQYSFLAAVPVMVAATSYDLMKSLPQLNTADIPVFAVGFLAAFVTATLAIKFFLRFIQNSDFKPFAWYRIGLSVVVLLLIFVF